MWRFAGRIVPYQLGLLGVWCFGLAFAAPGEIALSALNGENGLVIHGEAALNSAGWALDMGGDVNADGIDDLIIGANRTHQDEEYAGAAYVVFGTAGGLKSPLELSELDGTNGFELRGFGLNSQAGYSVSIAEDINGDDVDDLLIGARFAEPDGSPLNVGEVYVVFGSNQKFPESIDLQTITFPRGFTIEGINLNDYAGEAVAGVGDLNGDGLGDISIGATGQDAFRNTEATGNVHVIFGSTQMFPDRFSLSDIDGANGFTLVETRTPSDGSPLWVLGSKLSSAGDFNNDSYEDVMVSQWTGPSFVLYGQPGPFSNPIEADDLTAETALILRSENALPHSLGRAVGSGGDVNADGLHDVIIAGTGADEPNGINAGIAYVIFGDESAPAQIDLEAVDGTVGFAIYGASQFAQLGTAASMGGDYNGDGIDDVVIGASNAEGNGLISGITYVIYGRSSGFLHPMDLSNLDASQGQIIRGASASDQSGWSVAGPADFNNDGIDDIAIGAPTADPNGDESGAVYVVFGVSDVVFRGGFESL